MKAKYLFGLKCYYYNSYKKWYLAIAKHTHTQRKKVFGMSNTWTSAHIWQPTTYVCTTKSLSFSLIRENELLYVFIFDAESTLCINRG